MKKTRSRNSRDTVPLSWLELSRKESMNSATGKAINKEIYENRACRRPKIISNRPITWLEFQRLSAQQTQVHLVA
jgi:hypothetical protein